MIDVVIPTRNAPSILALCLAHYWSRVRTPKDIGQNERFNRTLSVEFIQMGNAGTDQAQLRTREQRGIEQQQAADEQRRNSDSGAAESIRRARSGY